MTIKYEKHVDWEPLTILLDVPRAGPNGLVPIQEKITRWFKTRDHQPICINECKAKYLNMEATSSGLKVSVEWMCKQCLEQFLKMIGAAFPEAESATIGRPAPLAGRIPAGEKKFVHVPSRSITVESGQKVPLDAFDISNYPVSVGEFEAFAAAVGYTTSGDLTKRLETYHENGTLYGIDATNRDRFEARFLSYADARAFCDYKKLRLPTDPELLAAITVDDEIRSISGNERAALFRRSPQLLHLQGLTLTSTLEGDKAVVRAGPWVTKHPGWETMQQYRLSRPKNDPIGQFYVVADKSEIVRESGDSV
jgi:hypothetical protein